MAHGVAQSKCEYNARQSKASKGTGSTHFQKRGATWGHTPQADYRTKRAKGERKGDKVGKRLIDPMQSPNNVMAGFVR
jgi:hypothetical protein